MEKIHISFMKDLKNIEFGELFDIVSTIVAAEKIGLSYLTMACEQLQPHTQDLLKLRNQKIKHPLTQIIREQVSIRTEYLAGLRMSIDAKMMWHKPEERIAAQLLQLWLKSYKEDLFTPSISKQSRMVDNLMGDRRENIDIEEATKLLDLDELLDEIVKITTSIRRNQLARLNEKDIYEVDGQAIRKAAYKDLKILVSVIDSSYNIGSNEEQREQLAALSRSLNSGLRDFHTLLKSRNTKRKNKKENATAVKELISNEAKNTELEFKNNKLPLVIYDELKTPNMHGAYASYTSQRTDNGTTPALGRDKKDTMDNRKSNNKNSANMSYKPEKDKSKEPKGRDGGLPPISKN